MRFADEFLFTWFSVQVTSMLSMLCMIIGPACDDWLSPRGLELA
jgi:hypothetical protein